ncbi:Holliday junction DNA helicase RuvB [Spiroplasma helicoides]|uniref:Holliday junction branch migration complex subunit RuvB n=1 Tax=Spiroplasma helicoides TaxID=216938 RepID=A0A1B3SKV7_9MOLU|nr:Holliday junction branch migration DNA helicase RuvB [Spiroplasma helicoides]AOG60547.1 Holliday junction DNA helicase RuvB [Spiroplasma helicoides]
MKLKFNENRPSSFDNYIGQSNIIKNLKIYIKSCIKRKSVLDHLLFYGPSGLGKTSLAYLISLEMNKKIYVLNGTSLQKPSDIISPLTTLKEGEILFIDEIHAISREVFEVLYPVLEDNNLSIIIGKDYNSKVVNINLPKFTLIGATTELNKLTNPFINRFPINFYFQGYSNEEIAKIIEINAPRLNLELNKNVLSFIAIHCKNNPRIAINVLKRLNDYIVIENPKIIDIEYICKVLKSLNIYKYGITAQDIFYLKILKENKIIGLESIKQIMNTQTSTIINNIEPNLLFNNLIVKTNKGRSITKKGEDFLNEIKFS